MVLESSVSSHKLGATLRVRGGDRVVEDPRDSSGGADNSGGLL